MENSVFKQALMEELYYQKRRDMLDDEPTPFQELRYDAQLHWETEAERVIKILKRLREKLSVRGVVA